MNQFELKSFCRNSRSAAYTSVGSSSETWTCSERWDSRTPLGSLYRLIFQLLPWCNSTTFL